MYSDIFSEMIALLAAGLGLLGLGVCHFTFARSSPWLRLGLAGCIAAGSTALAWAGVEHTVFAWLTFGIVGGVALASSTAFWKSSHWLVTSLNALTQRTVWRGGLVCASGLLVMGLALAKFEQDDARLLQETDDFIELLNARPPMTEAETEAQTDRGLALTLHTPVEPRVKATIVEAEKQILSTMNYGDSTIRSSPANDLSNCHGWVFTGGRYWVEGTQVAEILKANGYHAVASPKPGDLVVYREGDNVTHTAIVRYTAAGQAPIVEGKWGWMGVYLHAVDQSCYGRSFTYYRSPREGHLLVGMGGKPAPTGSVSEPPVTSETTD